MGMSFLWESHGKRPMGWDRHKLLWDGNGTDKYVPWTTLEITLDVTNIVSNITLKNFPVSRNKQMNTL